MDKQDITIVSTKEFEDWLRSIVDVSSRRKIILLWQEVKDDIEKL
jgi:hypothetical protein